MCVIGEGIAAFIVKLIQESNRQRSNNSHCEGRKEICSINLISNPWAYDVCEYIHDKNNNRGYYEIAKLQWRVVD